MSSGSYLPAGYSFPSYGGKVPGGEEGEKPSRSSPTMKPPSEAKALELLQQHASQYKSKSPSIPDNKTPHERERDRERERLLPSHHHLGYPLLSAQYDLSYTSGETRPRAGDDFKRSGVFLTTVSAPPRPLLLSHCRQSAGVRPVHVPSHAEVRTVRGAHVQSVQMSTCSAHFITFAADLCGLSHNASHLSQRQGWTFKYEQKFTRTNRLL